MKKLKHLLGVFVITACALFLVPNNVNAADIDSAESLKEVFKGKNATIKDTTITLTGDVEFKNEECTEDCYYDVVNIWGDDYVLNLNGHKLSVAEFYVVEGGSLEINDETGKGTINTPYMMIEPGAKAVINNGNFIVNSNGLIDNSGTLTINDGTFHSIWNFGTLTINDGNFANISNDEGTLYIKGGTFTSYKYTEEFEDGEIGTFDYFSMFNFDTNIVITGGKFVANGIDNALQIYGNEEYQVNENSIEDLIGKGYVANYEVKTTTEWDVSYSTVEIVKDETENILKKLAPNGVWKINSVKPTELDESESLLTAIANSVDLPKGYELQAWCKYAEPLVPENVHINILYNGRILAEKEIKATYIEPTETIIEGVTPVIDKINEKIGDNLDEENGFRLEDLYLINYLNASTTGMNVSLALNFSKDLIALTNGGNISYKYDTRLGSYTPTGLWGFSGGHVIVFHNNIAIGRTKIGLTTSNVLYVPSDTANTDEARIAAALKRIEDYLGTTKGIKIEKGGTLESLNKDGATWKDYGFIDEKTSGTNYYNVTINGKTYKFAICKKDAKDLETPEYLASDILSNISIKSNSTELPLDTAITVKQVTSKEIEKALGTDVYAAYDISLYSNAKQVNITKLEDGKFVVSIPVPEVLKNKEITVYYINSKGQKEEHTATVKDGMASFETDHFSTYVLAEKTKDIANPNTYDGITKSIILLSVSLLGIISALVCLKKRQENK